MRHSTAFLRLALLVAFASSACAVDQPTSTAGKPPDEPRQSPAPPHEGRPPAQSPTSLEQWNAQGIDHILLYRPSLAERAKAEVPAGRSSNIPALLQAIEKLRPLAAAHPGHPRQAQFPWEPASVYEPTDDELLLSLAGDRIWRSLQLAPISVLERISAENPPLMRGVTYPHIEILRLEVAGKGPTLLAAPPGPKRLGLVIP